MFFSYGQKMEWIRNIGTKSNRKLIEKKWLVGRKQWYGKEWWGYQESRNGIKGKNSQIPLFFEIISILLLLEKYSTIYHFLKLEFVKLEFDMELEFTKIEFLKKVHLELEFMELEFLVI